MVINIVKNLIKRDKVNSHYPLFKNNIVYSFGKKIHTITYKKTDY